MSVKMIQDRLNGYNCRSGLEEEQSIREITQEILLAALGRTEFFRKAGLKSTGRCRGQFRNPGLFRETRPNRFIKPTPIPIPTPKRFGHPMKSLQRHAGTA